MSHAIEKGTVASISRVVEHVLELACVEAKLRNKKAARPQVTERDFLKAYTALGMSP